MDQRVQWNISLQVNAPALHEKQIEISSAYRILAFRTNDSIAMERFQHHKSIV